MRWLVPFLGGIVVACVVPLLSDLVSFREDPAVARAARLTSEGEIQRGEIARQQRVIAEQTATISRLQALAATKSPAPPAPSPAKAPTALAVAATAMLNTPAMRKMMSSQQKAIIEDNYADFIGRLHFTDEERTQFIRLLAAKEQIFMDFGMSLLQADDARRKILTAQNKIDTEKADAAIREFFNNDADFAAYTTYTEQQPQRYVIKSLAPGLKAIEQPLTAPQETALIEAMQSERLAFKASGNGATAEASVEQQMASAEALQQRIADRAATILSPAQLEIFRQNQARQLQVRKVGLEMTRSMLGK